MDRRFWVTRARSDEADVCLQFQWSSLSIVLHNYTIVTTIYKYNFTLFIETCEKYLINNNVDRV